MAELMIIESNGKQDLSYGRFLQILVERGIDFTVHHEDEVNRGFNVPKRLKAIAYLGENNTGDLLAQFARQGGYVFQIPKISHGSDEIRNDEETLQASALILISNAGLTVHSAALRERLGRRDDHEIFAMLASQMEKRLPGRFFYGDPDLWHLGRPLLEWAQYTGNHDLMDQMCEKVDQNLKQWGPLPPHTDPIAVLRNFLYAYEYSHRVEYLETVKREVDRVSDTFPRIDGAILHMPGRDRWVWPEVSAMYGGTAAMLSRLTGEGKYLHDALTIIRKLAQWSLDERDGLYYHGGRPGWHNPVKWGRGNAWALLGILDVLENLPQDHPDFPYLTGLLEKSLGGLISHQTENGTWRNVLDDRLSMHETSCTCKFISIYGRAYWKGWLNDERILPMLEKAWFGIKCSLYGDVLVNWCSGTASVDDVLYYYRRPHMGYSPIAALWSGVETARARAHGENIRSNS